MKHTLLGSVVAGVVMSFAASAMAQTEIQWWHAMGGANGERIDKIAADFNATQSDYKIVPVNKGKIGRAAGRERVFRSV